MTFADVRRCSLSFFFSATAAVFTVGTALGGHAQTTSSTTKDARIGALIETLGRTKTPSSAGISPDGTTVAWAVRSRHGSQIHLTDVSNTDPDKAKLVGTETSATKCGTSGPDSP